MNQSPEAGNQQVGKGMIWLAAIGVLAGLTFMFQSMMPGQGGEVVSSLENGRTMVSIAQDRSGHYLADGQINGNRVRFLVDTGATDVAISERMAREMGLDFGPRITVQTAAGPAPAWMTRLERVAVGNLRLENVRATITPALGNEPLLGMSFLSKFDIRQEGETLHIASRN